MHNLILLVLQSYFWFAISWVSAAAQQNSWRPISTSQVYEYNNGECTLQRIVSLTNDRLLFMTCGNAILYDLKDNELAVNFTVATVDIEYPRGEFGPSHFGQLSHSADSFAVAETDYVNPTDTPEYYGRVRVFQFNSINSAWEQAGETLHGENYFFRLGNHMAFAGNVLALECFYESQTSVFDRMNSSHIKVFELGNEQPGLWTQVGNDILVPRAKSMQFSASGHRLVVGNHRQAYVFERNHDQQVWAQVGTTIEANDEKRYCDFTDCEKYMNLQAVISSSGDRIAVADGYAAEVVIYDFDPMNTEWNLSANINGFQASGFGSPITMSYDGNQIALYAGFYSRSSGENGYTNHGTVEVYKNQERSWMQQGSTIKGDSSFILLGRFHVNGSSLIFASDSSGNGAVRSYAFLDSATSPSLSITTAPVPRPSENGDSEENAQASSSIGCTICAPVLGSMLVATGLSVLQSSDL